MLRALLVCDMMWKTVQLQHSSSSACVAEQHCTLNQCSLLCLYYSFTQAVASVFDTLPCTPPGTTADNSSSVAAAVDSNDTAAAADDNDCTTTASTNTTNIADSTTATDTATTSNSTTATATAGAPREKFYECIAADADGDVVMQLYSDNDNDDDATESETNYYTDTIDSHSTTAAAASGAASETAAAVTVADAAVAEVAVTEVAVTAAPFSSCTKVRQVLMRSISSEISDTTYSDPRQAWYNVGASSTASTTAAAAAAGDASTATAQQQPAPYKAMLRRTSSVDRATTAAATTAAAVAAAAAAVAAPAAVQQRSMLEHMLQVLDVSGDSPAASQTEPFSQTEPETELCSQTGLISHSTAAATGTNTAGSAVSDAVVAQWASLAPEDLQTVFPDWQGGLQFVLQAPEREVAHALVRLRECEQRARTKAAALQVSALEQSRDCFFVD
jgi:hypothetical protein